MKYPYKYQVVVFDYVISDWRVIYTTKDLNVAKEFLGYTKDRLKWSKTTSPQIIELSPLTLLPDNTANTTVVATVGVNGELK